MGKTKTAFISDNEESKKPSYDKAAKEAKRKVKEEAEKVHLSGLKGGQRVKMVEITSEEGSIGEKNEDKKDKKNKKIRARGKKYLELKNKVDRNKFYKLEDAISLVKETSYSKFDGTVELHLIVKKKGLSANITLPYSSGKTKRIEIADDATLEKLKNGKIDFDLLLVTLDMMPKLVPFARILGPKGLMPNPKNGTIIKSPKDADKFKGNTLSIKTEKDAPVIHTIAGKVSQNEKELLANTKAIIEGLGTKQVIKGYIKATMGPSIKIEV